MLKPGSGGAVVMGKLREMMTKADSSKVFGPVLTSA
jgi:hypothetical protein